MVSYINTNISSLNAQKNLNTSQTALQTSMARLSSGMRINTAQDDAAGFAIATRLSSQINGLGQATLNANDAISLTQTADSGMSAIAANLQTMRTLAVQSSNSTYSASDRASMNEQVQQLKQEIDRVAGGANFNGLNLLDGSFTSQSFQVGAGNTSNDSIQVTSLTSMKTADLGGVGTSASTNVQGAVTTAALAEGDLTLNGKQVGASQLGAGAGQSTASAYSIAKAINLTNAGVTATADVNTVTGSAAATPGAIAADTFSINGINVGAVADGTNAQGQGANLAAAINKIATQTGVTASSDAQTGAVTLTAVDGRDINIGLNGNGAGAAGAAANKTAFLAATGFASANVGTQRAVTTSVASGAFTAADASAAGEVFELEIDGNMLYTETSTGAADSVTAAELDTAWDTFAATTAGAGYTRTGTFATNDVKISKIDGTAMDITLTSTFVTAAGSFAGAGFVGTTAALNTAADNAENHGTVSLNSTSSDGIVIGGAAMASAGLAAKAGQNGPTTTSSVSSIAAVDISTQAGAQSALSAIDGAISMVTTSQGLVGALQNRFTSAIANLQSTSTNLSAARSRIQDTDFAAETANMTRAQVLQQAGTAILAQANQAPNSVMSLLR